MEVNTQSHNAKQQVYEGEGEAIQNSNAEEKIHLELSLVSMI